MTMLAIPFNSLIDQMMISHNSSQDARIFALWLIYTSLYR